MFNNNKIFLPALLLIFVFFASSELNAKARNNLEVNNEEMKQPLPDGNESPTCAAVTANNSLTISAASYDWTLGKSKKTNNTPFQEQGWAKHSSTDGETLRYQIKLPEGTDLKQVNYYYKISGKADSHNQIMVKLYENNVMGKGTDEVSISNALDMYDSNGLACIALDGTGLKEGHSYYLKVIVDLDYTGSSTGEYINIYGATYYYD